MVSTLFVEGNETETEQVVNAAPARSSSCKSNGWPGGRFEDMASFFSIRSLTRRRAIPRTRSCRSALRSAGQGDHLQSHPRIRRPGIHQRRLPAGVAFHSPPVEASDGAASISPNFIRATSTRPSSVSCACKSGALGSTWTKTRTCCIRSRRARITPTTGSTGGWLQLGMNPPRRVVMRHSSEVYAGNNARYRGEHNPHRVFRARIPARRRE